MKDESSIKGEPKKTRKFYKRQNALVELYEQTLDFRYEKREMRKGETGEGRGGGERREER